MSKIYVKEAVAKTQATRIAKKTGVEQKVVPVEGGFTVEPASKPRTDWKMGQVFGKDELAVMVVKQAEVEGWADKIADKTPADIVKALGRSKKFSGAVWAVKQNLGIAA